jgi:hypothetical protein
MRSALSQTGGLELIDQSDHRAGIDPDRRADLLLDRRSARQKKVEHGKKRGRDADRSEGRRGLGVRNTPEAEEQLACEFGDYWIGLRARRHGCHTRTFTLLIQSYMLQTIR